MFIDSSALVAIIAPEEEGRLLSDQLDAAPEPVTSSLAIYETVLALVRIRRAAVAEAMMIVLEYLQRARILTLPIGADAHVIALRAHEYYGKGTGHPAQLNMGDCFSYAMAKTRGVPLLYKGDDFRHTDLG